jgi:MFS superfamily sulfate permease-like transporter
LFSAVGCHGLFQHWFQPSKAVKSLKSHSFCFAQSQQTHLAGTGNNGEGVELLFPSVMLAGLLMVLVSVTKLSRFITLLPSPVMLGICNGLAIVIGLSQLHPFEDHETHHWKEGSEMMWMLIICFTAMIIMECLPKLPFRIFKVAMCLKKGNIDPEITIAQGKFMINHDQTSKTMI